MRMMSPRKINDDVVNCAMTTKQHNCTSSYVFFRACEEDKRPPTSTHVQPIANQISTNTSRKRKAIPASPPLSISSFLLVTLKIRRHFRPVHRQPSWWHRKSYTICVRQTLDCGPQTSSFFEGTTRITSTTATTA
jgi:hypothetical protein